MQNKMINIQVLGHGASYIRDLTVGKVKYHFNMIQYNTILRIVTINANHKPAI